MYRWRSFVKGDLDIAQIDMFLQEADEAGHIPAVQDAYLAKLLTDPDWAEAAPDSIARFENINRSQNAGEIGYRLAFAEAAIALYRNSSNGLEDLTKKLNARVQPRGRLWIATECLLDSRGYSINIPPTQWLEDYEIVRDRWRVLFERWLARVSPSK